MLKAAEGLHDFLAHFCDAVVTGVTSPARKKGIGQGFQALLVFVVLHLVQHLFFYVVVCHLFLTDHQKK